MAAAIWSEKDMGSPSGGKARHRGGTQVGKAPPSPEMTISGLTKSGLSGRIRTPILLPPALPDVAARPKRQAETKLGSTSPKTQRKSLCAIGHSAPWP